MSRRELALLLGDMSLDVLVGPYNWLGWIGMCRKVISRGFIFFFLSYTCVFESCVWDRY